MPRPDSQLLAHFLQIATCQNPKVRFNNYSESASYNLYRKSLSSTSYDRILALALSTSLVRKKHIQNIIKIINFLQYILPGKEIIQQENLEKLFEPIQENSQKCLKIVKFDEISVFGRDEVLQIIQKFDQQLYEIVQKKVKLVELVEDIKRGV